MGTGRDGDSRVARGTSRASFAELRPEPAAAASIAQVHKARLRRDGGVDAEVAVKVQRPGIRATVEQNLLIVAAILVLRVLFTIIRNR